MRSMKLTSLLMMLLMAFSAVAQEEFFDDVYFSSKSKKKKAQVEEKQSPQPNPTVSQQGKAKTSSFSEQEIDAYNRRYSSDSDAEERAEGQEASSEVRSTSERHSDTEYTERIIRYHSPSKITITGADQVDLCLSDGYYSYDTNYSDGGSNVNVNINIGNAWGSPWYDPWYYGYNPWWTYSPRYYGPSWGFGWGWSGFYVGY